jgi:hypothetical protein
VRDSKTSQDAKQPRTIRNSARRMNVLRKPGGLHLRSTALIQTRGLIETTWAGATDVPRSREEQGITVERLCLQSELDAIASALADTSQALTGSEIRHILATAKNGRPYLHYRDAVSPKNQSLRCAVCAVKALSHLVGWMPEHR